MGNPSSIALSPRKKPTQARSQATVDAIFEATIQVLLSVGLQRLTTIRVAERAGASVGTLYQYYPHKQALLFAVLQRHLGNVEKAITEAAASSHHTPLATMVSAVIAALVKVKTERLDESRALYAVSTELNSQETVLVHERRCRTALISMLKTATDAKFNDLETVVFMLVTAMSGPTRTVVERGGPGEMVRVLQKHLGLICLGYLERVAANRRANYYKRQLHSASGGKEKRRARHVCAHQVRHSPSGS
jgi:AcrR family transcriptional regulator